MKLVRWGAVGREKPGMLDAANKPRDLSAVLHEFDAAALSPEGLARLRAIDPATLPEVPSGARLGSPVPRPGKIVCIGLNYADHVAETNSKTPTEPLVFMKATTSLCGPFDDVLILPGSVKTDYESELGIVIGTLCRRVSEADTGKYIAGFCTVNDVSERHWQAERGGQFMKGKSADTFCPVGPWLVTADEVPTPGKLGVWSWVNGEQRQNGTTSNLVFGVAEIVSYLSQFLTLEPGDIISTGTPAGVGLGFKPPKFLKAGDVMEIEVEGLGRQRNKLVQAA
jgi:2-keto-4-pentenoate hydratase/2-oxohepta-3-ene-1,7-dioic acid hydratase in catechol pathway